MRTRRGGHKQAGDEQSRQHKAFHDGTPQTENLVYFHSLRTPPRPMPLALRGAIQFKQASWGDRFDFPAGKASLLVIVDLTKAS
jgi:hypothetical protein